MYMLVYVFFFFLCLCFKGSFVFVLMGDGAAFFLQCVYSLAGCGNVFYYYLILTVIV